MSDIVLTEPTAYIYGGHRLPKLTCLDTYPYVIIYKTSLYNYYTAYCSTQALTIDVSSSDSTQYTLVQKGTRCNFTINARTQTSWTIGTVYETDYTNTLYAYHNPIWSSHKLTYPNGNIYIEASKAPSAIYEGSTEVDDSEFDLYSFHVGLIFGLTDDLDLIDSGMFEEDDYVPPVLVPVAYLYNGVRLPPLPEWDKSKYPYAAIVYYSTNTQTKYVLRCLTSDAYYEPVDTLYNTILYLKASGMTTCSLVDGKWDSLVEKTSEYAYIVIDDSSFSPSSELIWTNFDAEYNDTLYLSASDPVPVYE